MKAFLTAFFLMFSAFTAGALVPEPAAHPRILLREGEEELVREAVVSDPYVAAADSMIMEYADSILEAPVLRRVMEGKRLLGTSREALKRIFYLLYAYRIHGGDAYAGRAVGEMLNVCTFADWNPSHFLDVGEMAMAVGIGYDWLYGFMTEGQRNFIGDAVMHKAFAPSKDEESAWFYESPINWNQVCNAGLLYGALAIWDEHTAESARIVQKCLDTNPLSLGSYSPEGGYPEGYNYWGYSTSFEIMLAAALQSAFGSDCGLLEDAGGLFASAKFMQMMTTPLGRCWNFYDSAPDGAVQWAQAWIAGRTGDLSPLWPELRKMDSASLSDICEERLFPAFPIFAARLIRDHMDGCPLSSIAPPEDRSYVCGGTTPVFIYRSGWSSASDTYLAVKGGCASSSHAHNDIGSFYFEEDGVCWAADLGTQNYNSLETLGLDIWNVKQGSDRYEVFRIGPFSHNILTVNGLHPDVSVSVPFSKTWMPEETGDRLKVGAELDLGLYLRAGLDSCVRRVLLEDGVLTVSDRLAANDSVPALVRWQLCTEASVEILDDRHIRLSSGGKDRLLECSIEGPSEGIRAWTAPASFRESEDPEADHLHDFDAPNPGKTMTGFILSLPHGGRATMTVRFLKPD